MFLRGGLRALGVAQPSLASFPEECQQGIVARAQIFDGANHPDKRVGRLAGADLHAIVSLLGGDLAERERSRTEHEKLVAPRWIGGAFGARHGSGAAVP